MLLTIAITVSVALVSSEWVEISQQHYRKPVHLTQSYPSIPDDEPHEYFLEDSTTFLPDQDNRYNTKRRPIAPVHRKDSIVSFNYGTEASHKNRLGDREKIYSNVSITGQTANRHRNRAPGDIQRVNIMDLKPSLHTHPIRGLAKDRPPTEVTNYKDQVSATVERVPNMGNVFRVNLHNTPVKSPSIKNDITENNNQERDRVNFSPTNENFGDELVIKSDIFTNKPDIVGIADITKRVHDSDRVSLLKNITTMNTKRKPIQHPHDQVEVNDFGKINKSASNNTSYNGINRIKTKAETNNANAQTKFSDIFLKKGNKIDKIPKLVTETDQSENATAQEDTEEINTTGEKSTTNPSNIQTESENQAKDPHNDIKKENIKVNSNDVNVNAIHNVMKFMKVVTETISKNSKRGVGGKVKYLNELKDNLLGSIKARIDATWPDDDSARRRSRSTARGHVEFPSSESSLMTISFLTFAVFLIKLVLQVIQTYKNKSMMVAPLVVATAGRATRKLRHST